MSCRAGRPALAFAMAIGLASAGAAQTTTPIPPGIIGQDELDLQGRTNLSIGAGARAYGMSGAFLARADDATAASWNPAGLSYLRRPEVTAVGVHNVFNADATFAEGMDTRRFQGTVFDFAAITYPFSIKGLSGAAQVSYQRAIPFSGSSDITRQNADVTVDAQGGFDLIALGTGWRVSRDWRVGVTLNRWFNGYHQTLSRMPQAGRARQLNSEFDLDGWNVNLGFIWSPVDSLNVGAVGKTPFTANATLAKDRTDFVPSSDGELIAVTTNSYSSDDVRLDLPGAVGVGISWRPRSQLTISSDYTRTFWSDARIHNYFVLPFAPVPQPSSPPVVFPSLPYPLLTESQEDSVQIRVGGEYVWILSHIKLPFRAGYFADRQIFRANDGTPPWFNGVTVGTGIIVGPILFDIAYLYESGSYVDGADVTNVLKTHRFFASLIYRHRGLP